MNEPTKEQIKEFWECFGFHSEYFEDEPETIWAQFYPDGSMATEGYPPIDLNNLFKYAVPKLKYCSLQFHGMTYVADVSIAFADHHVWSGDNPALALFWALWQVKEQNE